MSKAVKKLLFFVLSGSIICFFAKAVIFASNTDLSLGAEQEYTDLSANAAAGTYSGIQWSFDAAAGTLKLSGSGTLTAEDPADFPWYEYRMYIKRAEVGSGITEIGEDAFQAYFYLKEMILNEGLKAVKKNAFQACPIESIAIPATLVNLDMLAFNQSHKLSEITVAPGNQAYAAINNIIYSKDKTILYYCPEAFQESCLIIPSGVTEIAEYAISDVQIKELILPDTLKTIGYFAFTRIPVTSLTIPDSVEKLGSLMCLECDSLKTVTIGSGVKEIPVEAFLKCENLETVIMESGVTAVSVKAFNECHSLTEVQIPATVKVIRDSAFKDCSSLTGLIIPAGTKEIYADAFWGSGLTAAALPATITYVGENAFPAGCSVPYLASMSELGNGAYVKAAILYVEAHEIYSQAFEVLKLVNQERQKTGAAALTMDKELLMAAMLRASETSIYYSHTRPCNYDCFTATKKMYGENIAAGQGDALEVMDAWMNSPVHKANILSPRYKNIGIGCVKVNGVNYWVQAFGTSAADPATSNMYQDGSRLTGILTDLDASFYTAALLSEKTELTVGEVSHVTYLCSNDYVKVPLEAKSFEFKSSDVSVCTISAAGELRAVGGGTASVSAYPKGYSHYKKEITIKVKEKLRSQTKPAKFSLAYKKDGKRYIVTIPKTAGAQYSFDGKNWSSSNTKSSCLPGQTVTGFKRKAAKSGYSASGAVSSKVTLPKLSQTAPAAPQLKSKTHRSIKLVRLANIEYSKDKKKWQTSAAFTGLKKNTKYNIYIRKKATATHKASKAGRKLSVTTYKGITDKPGKRNVPLSKKVKKNTYITIRAPKGAALYYTVNGKQPNTKSKKLAAGKQRKIKIKKKTTLRVLAAKKNYTKSGVVVRTYKVK